MASISLKNIHKLYPESSLATVSDFNAEIEERKFIILVGPSGCGKTTTLRMIAVSVNGKMKLHKKGS